MSATPADGARPEATWRVSDRTGNGMIPRMSDLPPPGPQQPSQEPVPPAPPYGAQPPPYGTQPPPNPYQPYAPGYGPTGVPQWAPDHPQATTVLLLGILGLALCQLLAPFAWIKGSRVKKEIDAAGGAYGGRSQVQIGYVLGIVGTALLGITVVGFFLYIVIVVIAVASSA